VDVRRLGELPEEAGFAHAGLAEDRHHLAVARAGLFEGLVQGRYLGLAAHKGRQAPRRGRL